MGMDATRLGEKLATAVTNGAPSDDSPVSASALEAIWIAIAQEIITEITGNATVQVVSVQPGAGTADGTVTG